MENGTGEDDRSDPNTFLAEAIGSRVIVKLHSGMVYTGELLSVDGYMNLALERAKEVVEGSVRRNYGDTFIRGNNVMYVSLAS